MKSIIAIALGASASVAAAQSATVTVDAPATAQAGETFTATVSCDFDAMGAGDGIFGMAGLFLHGGDLNGTGPATASNIALDASFPALQAAGSVSGASATRVGAGVGAAPALTGSPANLFSVDITVDAGANNGDMITLGYDGAVVLDANNSLVLIASNDPNAIPLTVVGATITVGGGGCNAADIAEPFGTLDIADVVGFLQLFGAQDPAADLAAPMGVFDIADVVGFLQVFGGGCP